MQLIPVQTPYRPLLKCSTNLNESLLSVIPLYRWRHRPFDMPHAFFAVAIFAQKEIGEVFDFHMAPVPRNELCRVYAPLTTAPAPHREGYRIMGRAILYSIEELTWIEANKQLPRREAHAKFCTKFHRNNVSPEQFKSLCTRNGWKTGRTGCYVPGQVSHNKGKKMPFNVNSAKTRFKKGQLPHNTKHLGHERLPVAGNGPLLPFEQYTATMTRGKMDMKTPN